MSLHKNELISTLQQQPHLLQDFPWYPTGFLANSQQNNNLQKLAAFINNPLRLHLLVSADEIADDILIAPPAFVPETEVKKEEEISLLQNEIGTESEQQVANGDNHQPETAIMEETREIAATSIEAVTIKTETVSEEPEEKPFILPAISLPTTTEESFRFQPFHTVDYFASLGIKVDQSNITSTRFDSQLKSFTQWLKTMKRADYQTGQIKADPVVDAQAKASLEVKEIVTEAMADVLAQQGRHAQAIEVYRKLTLLHPEKTAFFAAQIEKLKA